MHLADADALPMLRQARADGVRITVETCPHYLTFAAEQVPDGATSFKCCPPIREARAPRGAVGGAAATATSTWSSATTRPCTPDLKRLDVGDFGAAWGGIASLQVALPAVWTGARERGIGLDRGGALDGRGAGPAGRAAAPRARSRSGKDADLVAFAPDERWTVGDLEHRNPVTPYAGRELTGVVRRTWLRGQLGRRLPDRAAAGAGMNLGLCLGGHVLDDAIGRGHGCSRNSVTADRRTCHSDPARSQHQRSPMTDFTRLPDLAARALGGAVVAANDEFFAAKENLVLPEPPAARTEFGHKGKEYDGWETRRRRSPGHDWAIVRLGAPGIVAGVVVDTAFFTGNYPPRASARRRRDRGALARSTSCARPTGSRCCRCQDLAGNTAQRTSRSTPTAGSPTCG